MVTGFWLSLNFCSRMIICRVSGLWKNKYSLFFFKAENSFVIPKYCYGAILGNIHFTNVLPTVIRATKKLSMNTSELKTAHYFASFVVPLFRKCMLKHTVWETSPL